MQWQAPAVVLNVTRHGESDAVLEVMTEDYGRHRGFVKGGLGRRQRAVLQPGNHLQVVWRSRIEENLGRFTAELTHSPIGSLIGDGAKMSALSALLAVVASTLPEREPHPAVYTSLRALIAYLETGDADLTGLATGITRLELGILKDLGYGLELSQCAGTGSTENLIYVSPKSGRAVSADAGQPYAHKLLPLPAFLTGAGSQAVTTEDALNGLDLTGFFLSRHIWQVKSPTKGAAGPQARTMFVAQSKSCKIIKVCG